MSLRLFKEELFLFFCLFVFSLGDSRRLLLLFIFFWSSAEGEWNSKSLRYGGNSVLKWIACVAFSRSALVKLLLGSSFLDVSLNNEWHVTSNFNYFNSVIWTMVSYIVEALTFLQAPRSPYESTGSMYCIFLNVKCWLKTVLSCV